MLVVHILQVQKVDKAAVLLCFIHSPLDVALVVLVLQFVAVWSHNVRIVTGAEILRTSLQLATSQHGAWLLEH
jgi:hypothetical protein